MNRKGRDDYRGSERPVFRVAFHYDGPIKTPTLAHRSGLSGAEVEEISLKLQRMDRLSRNGPWTSETLELIRRHPSTAAGVLAGRVGREKMRFKADVRKLKKLGLTISHKVGYEISRRGRAYLQRIG